MERDWLGTKMIMLDFHEKAAIPVNDGIFEISQFKSSKKLNAQCAGNIILYSDGNVKRIKGIKVKGIYGNSFFEKIFSALNYTLAISVELEPLTMNFEQLKSQFLEFLQNDQKNPDPYLPQSAGVEVITRKVSGAQDVQSLFSAIEVPQEDDCLDIL